MFSVIKMLKKFLILFKVNVLHFFKNGKIKFKKIISQLDVFFKKVKIFKEKWGRDYFLLSTKINIWVLIFCIIVANIVDRWC
jgi:hypothetical protein